MNFGDSLNIFWEVLVTVLEGDYLTLLSPFLRSNPDIRTSLSSQL